MRLGVVLPDAAAIETAEAADRNGIPFVVVPAGPVGTGTDLAAAVAARTVDTRIVTTLALGFEHPVTLAEELSIVDHVSGGRAVALVDTAALDAEAASEDLAVLRKSWSGRWVRHRGTRWTVPAGIHGEGSPEAVSVTPWPAQLTMPVWVAGAAAAAVAGPRGLPALAETIDALDVDAELPAIGRHALVGDLDTDREALLAWADSGTSHLLIELPVGAEGDAAYLEQTVARFLVPEVATPSFPRIVAESAWPMRWQA